MNNYWKDHYNSNAEVFIESPLKQVDRTLNGRETDQSQIDLTVDAVVNNLSISRSDYILDICCGNGLITKAVAERGCGVVGVDFSEKLIENARRINTRANIEYVVSDILALDVFFFDKFDKIYMRDSVSCLNSEDLLKLLNGISRAPRFKMFFVGGVPDREKLEIYYDNEEKLAFYHQRELEGKPHIGTWWSRNEMSSIVKSAGLRVSYIPQDLALCSAYYRYDCLIEKM